MNVRLPNPLFTRTELWYHGLMMPILFPAGNYFFLHERYFTDPAVFLWGTLLVAVLYAFSLILLTLVVKMIIRQFPDVQQVWQRNGVALLAVTTLTIGLAVFDVWAYGLFPIFERPFSWGTVRAIVILGAIFDLLLCFVLGIQYTYSRWQENQIETEQLKRAALQHDFDALKQQIDPHFLFNSLTSLSALIGQNQQQAGLFVDHLAKVYRYRLSTSNQSLTPLNAEIAFVNSYIYLLKTRYQSGISVHIEINANQGSATLPLLSLQLLLDYAVRHNVVSVQKPLTIRMATTSTGTLRVSYNRQPRPLRLHTGTDELVALLARYATLPVPAVEVADTGTEFSITLPLLAEGISVLV
ncbi:sensor histidine kinase [Salmonirosea aquatica]|uniref:Histidine kinase n=1 Tax=Salmonirosea aquatica TaxID=2654236 RepID=A0A7C9F608_9BACT|nr:histidine kinase [Cytophagaceae bacterium SJW1-29]